MRPKLLGSGKCPPAAIGGMANIPVMAPAPSAALTRSAAPVDPYVEQVASSRPLATRALDTPVLTEDESALVETWRDLSEYDRGRVRILMKSLALPEERPTPLGDTPEEIAAGNRWAAYYLADLTVAEWVDGVESGGGRTGARLRALVRVYRERVAAVVARAAELDREQKRGSWAEPWQAQAVRGVLAFLAWLFPPGPTHGPTLPDVHVAVSPDVDSVCSAHGEVA